MRTALPAEATTESSQEQVAGLLGEGLARDEPPGFAHESGQVLQRSPVERQGLDVSHHADPFRKWSRWKRAMPSPWDAIVRVMPGLPAVVVDTR